MNLRKWEYFLKAAEFGNLSRVAEKLDISQPALSRQIVALEQEIGASLFHRTGRGLTLTPAGEVFRARAEAILEEIARVPEEVMHVANTPSGRLAFGAPPFMGRVLTGELVATYVETYPHVRLRVRGAHSFQLREAIFFRDIDIGILAAPLTEPDLHTEPLLQEQLYLVGPDGSGISPEQPITLEMVADRPLILTPRPDGLRTLIETEFARIGRRAKVAVETEYAPMDDLIRRKVGFTIMPFCGMVNSPLTQLAWAPIEGLSVTWLIALLENSERTLAAKRFIELLQTSTKENIRSGRWEATYLGR
ncbi:MULTISPECIES: LysR family transcriptional regulator [Rhizobium]|uniref:LysR family nitrogen assimilation transcriptional regulator n=1 Tax=Rhizobium miluonense TaxID=411945 RepID=A0ABU1SWZ2_9HYPH|nr:MULTISPECIES: LysR family transcriptional regulator [Rhizobium]MBB3428858.1 LysR family nitrogen assimilation transcriptional regulator [Rhizobium sp. BK312]MDR6903515.1 LysR family nitrogen assimilation transcriptional regulator [Rhizobium miluonense]